jgi:hypothetical protein
MHRQLISILVAAALFVVWAPAANGDMTVFEFDYEFSGSGYQPQGDPPWLTAVFDDGGSPGSVTLTLTSNLVDDEFIGGQASDGKGLFFNFSDGLGLAAGDIAQTEGPSAGWQVDQDGLKADGDGYYDFRFYWSSSADRFEGGDVATFAITHAGITAGDFDELSLPGGGNGVYPAAAHIQGIEGGGSGWIAPTGTPIPPVPAPGAAILGAIGLLSTGAIRRRFS